MKGFIARLGAMVAIAIFAALPAHAQSVSAAQGQSGRQVEMQGLASQVAILQAKVTSATDRLFKIKYCHGHGYLFRDLSDGTEDCKAIIPCQSPFNDGHVLAVGDSLTAYQSPTVPYGTNCTVQTRTCDERTGTLTGSYMNQTCTITPPANCALPWGGVLASGQSVTAFASPNSSCGTTEVRTCTNGTLSGSYQYGSCNATCGLPWGGTINSGGGVTAYAASSVPYGSSCTSQVRACNAGTLSGSYQYPSCAAQAKWGECVTLCYWWYLYAGTGEYCDPHDPNAGNTYMCNSPPSYATMCNSYMGAYACF